MWLDGFAASALRRCSSSSARFFLCFMKKNKPPMIPAITTTPITTPAAIPAVFGLLDPPALLGVLDGVMMMVSAGALVADARDELVDDATELDVVDDATGDAVGMLSAIPLS